MWWTVDAVDLLADLGRVGVDERGDREAALGEPAVVGEGAAEVAGPDDGDGPVVGEAELAAHLEQQVLDVVADAPGAVGARGSDRSLRTLAALTPAISARRSDDTVVILSSTSSARLRRYTGRRATVASGM